MKIISWNINGIRSAEREGNLSKLLENENPDILCLQEIKMNEEFADYYKYDIYYNFAKKKGYSGVAIFTKEKPLRVQKILNLPQFDDEGRFLLLEYSSFILIDIYIPHGGRNKENHPYKFASLEALINLVDDLDKDVIICTDFNIAHTEKDVKNYKTNKNNNMFSPPERKYIDILLSKNFVDSFRALHDEDGVYSMWPNGFDARTRNMGWRIDYIFTTESMKAKIRNVEYLKKYLGSDHCPCVLELEE